MADTAKRLIMVNGPMGVGKTAVCRRLVRLCAPAAFLDGDWCWMLEPFAVTPQTKALVLTARVEKDIGAGLRGADAVARALCYREAYAWAPCVVDTTRLSPGEAAQAVLAAL